MGRFILQRFLQAVPTLLLVTILSFVLMHSLPGGPAEVMLGSHATAARLALVRHAFGLDKPLIEQYLIWLGQVAHGNFGYAYDEHATVLSLIAINMPRTLVLVAVAILFSHLLAILLGTAQAVIEGSLLDHVITTVLYFLYAMPGFWLAMLAIEFLALQLGWFPAGGITAPYSTGQGLASYADHLILPDIVLVFGTIAGWTRYMKSATLETLGEDYLRTAHAKGLAPFTVLYKHALRNSVLPLITLLGLSLPNLFSGALIIEMVFNYPGMGLLFWDAAQQRDYPILLATIVLVGFLTVLGNLMADILYAVMDHRIQYQ